MFLTDTRPQPTLPNANRQLTSVAREPAPGPPGPAPGPRPARWPTGPLRHPGWSAAVCLTAALVALSAVWPDATPRPAAVSATAAVTVPAVTLGH